MSRRYQVVCKRQHEQDTVMKHLALALVAFLLLPPTVLSQSDLAEDHGLRVKARKGPGAEFGSWKTYYWLPRPEAPINSAFVDNPALEGWIRSQVEAELDAKGYVNGEKDNAQFGVAYSVAVKSEEYLGAHPNAGFSHRYHQWKGSNTSAGSLKMHEYKEGTLILDLVDLGRARIAWRGEGHGRGQDVDRAVAEQIVRELVRRLLEHFPQNP